MRSELTQHISGSCFCGSCCGWAMALARNHWPYHVPTDLGLPLEPNGPCGLRFGFTMKATCGGLKPLLSMRECTGRKGMVCLLDGNCFSRYLLSPSVVNRSVDLFWCLVFLLKKTKNPKRLTFFGKETEGVSLWLWQILEKGLL